MLPFFKYSNCSYFYMSKNIACDVLIWKNVYIITYCKCFFIPNLHIIYVFGSINDLPLLLQQHLKTLTIHYQSYNMVKIL